jgi:hypothetical protein
VTELEVVIYSDNWIILDHENAFPAEIKAIGGIQRPVFWFQHTRVY